MITREQCRAARLLLGWNYGQLAAVAKVGVFTAVSFENGGKTHKATVAKIRGGFESAGIVFNTDNGSPIRRLKGYTDA